MTARICLAIDEIENAFDPGYCVISCVNRLREMFYPCENLLFRVRLTDEDMLVFEARLED